MKLKSILFIGAAVFTFSCATKVNTINENTSNENKKINRQEIERQTLIVEEPFDFSSTVMTENQIQGKNLYETNCASCHQLYNPKEFSKENWNVILKKMQPNTDINDQQREQIYDYLTIGM
jgi:cytochrome c5